MPLREALGDTAGPTAFGRDERTMRGFRERAMHHVHEDLTGIP